MNNAKNFIFSDGVHSDYENFFWLYDDHVEFYYSDDFFLNNFFEVIKDYRYLKFDGNSEEIQVNDFLLITKRLKKKKKQTNILVHIYK